MLYIIAFISGFLTILTPCVLPMLPILLGASAEWQKNKIHSYVIIASLLVSIFAFTIILNVIFKWVFDAMWLNIIGGIIIGFYGLSLLFPKIWTKISTKLGLSKIWQTKQRDGFLWDIILGASLGPSHYCRNSYRYFFTLFFINMTSFFCLPVRDFSNREHQFTIATCPIVVNKTGDKILLHIGTSTQKWQFIGGRYEDTMTFRENAILHGKKELGANNNLELVDADNPIILFDIIDLHGYEEETLLIHYEAKISDDENIGKSRWFSLHEIEILDAKNETSSPNVRIVAEKILTKK